MRPDGPAGLGIDGPAVGLYSLGMRVTGGSLRGRQVKVPRGDAVRPTQDMVRQALFSVLASHVPGARFLDLFAGSGAVGLEAWSRGAAYVCWVEADARVFRVLSENLNGLCGDVSSGTPDAGWRAIRADVFRFLKGAAVAGLYDTIFADPPYDRDGKAQWAGRLLQALADAAILSPSGVFVMEQAADEPEAVHWAWETVLSRTYGGTRLMIYRKRGSQ